MVKKSVSHENQEEDLKSNQKEKTMRRSEW